MQPANVSVELTNVRRIHTTAHRDGFKVLFGDDALRHVNHLIGRIPVGCGAIALVSALADALIDGVIEKDVLAKKLNAPIAAYR